MEEIWKDVDGFEGIYQVSNLGRVKSLERVVNYPKCTKHVKEHIMSGSDNGHGYLTVMMRVNNKGVRKYIHRLVAQAFIPNPKNLPEVNHKDENRSNNNVMNLEWVDYLTNRTYGTRLRRLSDSNTKHVCIVQYSLNFDYIREYKSPKQAVDDLGVNNTNNIYKCLNKQANTAYGYIWRYKEDTDIYDIPLNHRGFTNVYQYDATTGELIKHHYNTKIASEEIGVSPVILRKYIDTNTVIHNYFWCSKPLSKIEVKEKIETIQNSLAKNIIVGE